MVSRVDSIGAVERGVGSPVSMASSSACSLCRSVPSGRRKVHVAPDFGAAEPLPYLAGTGGVSGVICRAALFHGAHGGGERRVALRRLLRRRHGRIRGPLPPLSGSARPAPRPDAERSGNGRGGGGRDL